MKAVIQRIKSAKVSARQEEYTARIESGLLILLGIESADEEGDIEWLIRKIIRMRIFPDDQGMMNKSLLDKGGEAMVISQFTLHASTKKGNRPSFIQAARPKVALPLYDQFVEKMKKTGISVKTGVFSAYMEIDLVADGPVTIIIDSRQRM